MSCATLIYFFACSLVELLRSKLSKAEEELETIESIEASITAVQKNLNNLQSEVPAFYVWGENTDTTESLLKVFLSIHKYQCFSLALCIII